MACPLFIPGGPAGTYYSGALPLGELYTGSCAASCESAIPEETLHRFCNMGYGRGVCERAAGADADAARFLVRSDHDGRIEIAWSLERNHHPVAVGNVVFDREPGGLLPESEPSAIERQAEAFAISYLRKTSAVTPLRRIS